ncbi:hypothetical protein CJ030_MR4G020426 [Morella rubra]|uniref:Uncharacterized protein n=1 Tax=Morella rubra TaxID=262757 RepID=A0A6A1VS36_9ROSI|nr:hypothetical protein CJ030_MR4G020426 [Morella rubra]
MKRGREFPSLTSGQLHGSLTLLTGSPILSLSPCTPSLRPNASMSQAMSASKHKRGRTRGVSFEKGLGFRKLSMHIAKGECGEMSFTVATLSTKIGMLDHFNIDYTRQEDVRMVVETMMMARRTHRNWMHVYFKKFQSKDVALLKPHPDNMEEQW